MKLLKFKYILTLAIVLIVGITLMVFFLGGIKATALENSNLDFTYEGYLDYSEYDADGNRWVFYATEAEMNNAILGLDPASYILNVDGSLNLFSVKYILSSTKIVAQNSTYTMFLDEKTTIVSVGVNSTATPTVARTFDGFIKYDIKTFGTIFDSAIKEENDSKANLIVQYVGSNQKVSSIKFDTITNSVAYKDLLLDRTLRHYKIKFDIENGIEILYEIGDFTVIKSFFPERFDREDLFNYFRGNLTFVVDSGLVINENLIKYTSAYTWSAECAAYLEEKGLATVKENFTGNTAKDENGNPIPVRYDLSNILEKDEDGKELNVLRMKIGVDYNAKDFTAEDASPCITNPFANSYVFMSLFGTFYNLPTRDEKDENIVYSADWKYNSGNLAPYFMFKANSSVQFIKMYEYMYKKDTITEPNYLYEKTTTITITDKNYLQYSGIYPGIKVGDKISLKNPVSYFEDLSTVVKGYYSSATKKFYSDTAFNKEIEGNETKNYVDAITWKTYVYNKEEKKYLETNCTMPIGGFQARDEDGNFLYDESGKPVQEVFTMDLANIQNEKYGIEVESAPPIFQIGVRFELTENGLKTTILNDSIIDGMGKGYRVDGKRIQYSHDAKILKIQVLPYLTSNSNNDSKGQIIVPDGSGAIISFNSPKAPLGFSADEKMIYGIDKAFTYDRTSDQTSEKSANKQLMLGMYGFLDQTKSKGILAIADKGSAQTSIYANFMRGATGSKNIAYFSAYIRESETVFVGSAREKFEKWAKERSSTDFSYIYEFLLKKDFIDDKGSIQYVTLAQKYRQYLVEKYDLELKDETDDNVLALTFLGAFEKKEVTFGFAHNVDYSLTTFNQAKNIITELQDEGALELVVAYKAWTSDSMEPRATNNVKVSKVLGGAKGIKSLKQFLDENDIKLYPEVRITGNKGYDYSFGNLKYTSKSIGSTYAQHREYNLATGRSNQTIQPLTMLSPVYYVNYVNSYLKSYNKLGLNSAFLSDLGNVKVGDYSKSRITYAEGGLNFQREALASASKKIDSMMLSAPFDYAFQYTDFAVDVPLESTLLGFYDYIIPFYQLVVSGLFDYAGPAVNYDSEKDSNWYLLKAIETGSNLQFLLSAEYTSILLDTDYTMYNATYYNNLKNDIIYMNNVLNTIGIHNNSLLIGHKILEDSVYEVRYSNGLKIIINYKNIPYYDYVNGLSVKANWFLVTEGAK